VDDELMLRVISGKATNEEAQAVRAWRRAAPENEERYAALERLLGDTTAWYKSVEVPPVPSAQQLIRRATPKPAPRIGGPIHRAPSEPAPLWKRRGLVWSGAATAAVAMFALGIAAERTLQTKTATPDLAAVEFGASDSGDAPLLLNDGTRVRLGAGSRLRLEPIRGVRQVWVQGRAEFTVAHDPSRPFRVRTATGQAEDLGTRFVVRSDSSSMQVAVFDGRVALTANGGRVELVPGDVGRVEGPGQPEVAARGDPRQAQDWLHASLVFFGTPMSSVARRFEAQYGVHIRFADSVVSGRTVDAWFQHEPTAREALGAICRAVDARCEFQGSTVSVAARAR
jgi:transmembrane sensor